MTRSEFMKIVEAFQVLRAKIDDETALTMIDIYPTLKGEGALVEVGSRFNFNGAMYRARVDLWDIPDNTPDKAPNLWELVTYNQGYRNIPENITAENPFMKDEKGWWKDKLYVSLIDNNVWTPDAYAAGWKEVTE